MVTQIIFKHLLENKEAAINEAAFEIKQADNCVILCLVTFYNLDQANGDGD
jgi:hypothetical protein